MTTDANEVSQKSTKKGPVRRAMSATYSLLGFKDVANGLGKQAENLQDAAERNKNLYQKYRDAIFKKKAARKETYEAAVARLKLTPKDLEERRKQHAAASYIFMTVLAGTLYFLADALMRKDFANAFTLLTMSMFIGALVFQARFRVWQIEQKNLGSVKEYIDHVMGKG